MLNPDDYMLGVDKGDSLNGERIVVIFKRSKKNYVAHGSSTHNAMVMTFEGDEDYPVLCTLENTFHSTR
jgi:hypothetical protein